MQQYASSGSYQPFAANAHSPALQQVEYSNTSGSSFSISTAAAIHHPQRRSQRLNMPRTKAEAPPRPLSPELPIPEDPQSPLPEFISPFDLRCSLCPKTPKFSDISHLLTHISSKSHLSNKFRLDIESRLQKDAKARVDEFDYWYNTNNLDALLSDRMVAKEDKQKRKDRMAGIKQEIKQEFKVSKKLKTEAKEDSEFRAPSARTPQTKLSTPIPTTLTTGATGGNEESVYSTPKTRSKVPNFSEEVSLHGRVDPSLVSGHDDEEAETTKGESKVPDSDCARLKGIQWPGMRVFDAATPEGRRMRNQRKDSKVLRDMMATSKGVEPAEISYHPDGAFRGSRDIFGPLSTESSPVQVQIKRTPKRRASRATSRKPTFKDVSTNATRRPSRAKKSTTSAVVVKPKPVAVTTRLRHPSSNNPPNFNPLAAAFSGFNGDRHMSVVDEDDEFRLTVGDFEKKKKPFSVFEDNISPSRTESPLEETRFEFSHPSHALQPTWGSSMSSGQIPPSPTPVAKPASQNVSVASEFNPINSNHGPADVSTNHPFHTRRTMSDSSVFAAPMAFQNDFNPLFNHGNHGNHGHNVLQRSYSTFQPQYLFGGQHSSNNYLDSHHMHGSIPSYGFQSNFMGDFRQLNPIAPAAMNQMHNTSMQPMQSMQSMASVADMGTTKNENDNHYNM